MKDYLNLPTHEQLLPYISFGVLILIVIATTAAAQRVQDLRKRASVVDRTSEFTLEAFDGGTGTFLGESFSASDLSGDTFKVELDVYPNDNAGLCAVDFVLRFDPDLMQLKSVEPGGNIGNFTTFVPRTTDGESFDSSSVADSSSNGKIRFGAAAFDWDAGGAGAVKDFETQARHVATLEFELTGQGGQGTIEFEWAGTTDSNAVRASGADTVAVDILKNPAENESGPGSLTVSVDLAITLPANVTFEGIYEGANSVSGVLVVLLDGGTLAAQGKTTFVRNADGTYSGNISFDVSEGDYNVLVKGPLHLALGTKSPVTLTKEGPNEVDFSDEVMQGGDTVADNEVNMSDLGKIIDKWHGTEQGADVNFDGEVNMADLGFVLANWLSSGEPLPE